jgi:hypothetical protein
MLRIHRTGLGCVSSTAFVAAVLIGAPQASAQSPANSVTRYPLQDTRVLQPHNVAATVVTHAGRRSVRLTMSNDAKQRLAGLTVEQQARYETLAVLTGTDFGNGVIEAEVAGAPAPDAPAGARGFVGIAFRVRPDLVTYDAFYLRPTNGRALDQERRNHAVQYISHPAYTWERLRRETPSRYEAYVDLEPDVWTRIRIEVAGDSARLFVHGQSQPTLIVNDLKTGAQARGAVALWINPGTVAHFRNVRVTAAR